MKKRLTYADAGVDRDLRKRAKSALRLLAQTYKLNPYGEAVKLPYGNIFPVGDRYLDLAIEGVGTKVLVAQLANKYDTIGVDGIAMAVNDVIRSGARPLAIADNIHAQISDPSLVREWMKGIVTGAVESQCIVAGGEIGDVPELIKGLEKGRGFDMIVSCVGEVDQDQIILGNDIKPGDAVVGLRSSGIHSNGITLARKALFKKWGGKFNPHDVPAGLDRELVFEVLEPTKIYSRPLQEVMRQHRVKGTVHITGDAYLKFNRLMQFSKGMGFDFTNFKPQPIFELIQRTAKVAEAEMLKTFNMGWGFALIVERDETDNVLDILERVKVEAEVIGEATSTRKIVARYKGKKIALS
ncbi:MAG: phosphoribosylformylglycinamidine cyclo-ligase [Candidatus Bathyarchaeia archaeon]